MREHLSNIRYNEGTVKSFLTVDNKVLLEKSDPLQ